ncbi:MAG: hypothetical protein A2504_15940 [Bdellovibrionales bacterium RIFOXYD12_FULL_39_22]|nr:MAG: hypothetical protein A2385_07850 [Bdellovibrionales bacterium RIFOXYB1_FULL_39_21]OFZ43027.1 MAG: hypothetical protein A2485_11375 [Bdellovibrionales bacterium RIFOXYC12_FULL_39_17]OFZ50887.1 MAG: hypothetical protein A2404_06765 [Bdellovibrionales bacterium RIFOXYC1_FULL_39_130]OFZ78110.1 MAG: hypothetical protein A2560_01935 [Bdellovibrionales bacterium RIFOXYD1_FULL_39_84]OFZ93978.1 MAG: hypothetical protein A2504_15940 [Bdellovibrionales bacterium RIFOXYD12_FULL_39_22]HLE10427.1 gl
MHIVECFIEAGGFDYNLIRGGISVYIWNLARKFKQHGHKVSVVTAANGQIPYLKSKYHLKELNYKHQYVLPLVLDQAIWKNHPAQVDISLSTKAFQVEIDGVEFYFLSNEYLDMYPASCFPPYESKGKELGFFKPIVYQVDAIEFIKQYFKNEKCYLHAHEPYYQYLFPLAFRDDNLKAMISTVQSNMPINKKIYRPKLEKILSLLGISVDLDQYMDKLDEQDPEVIKMRKTLPITHLFYNYDDKKYINFYSLMLDHSDKIDFLSEGHLEFYTSFANTPFEFFFKKLKVSHFVEKKREKLFVGWCGTSDEWLSKAPDKSGRKKTLDALGLKDNLPTFYHNARFAINHKGQYELMQAIDRFLSAGGEANFIVRCLCSKGIEFPYFHEVKNKFPHNVYLEWETKAVETLMRHVSASDFCIFPSKFEMDTFLIAQGEAMFFGLVPIATNQKGMQHWNHHLPIEHLEATGFALKRSFEENDQQLVAEIVDRIRDAIALKQDAAETYVKLSNNSKELAKKYSWEHAAQAHLDAFRSI